MSSEPPTPSPSREEPLHIPTGNAAADCLSPQEMGKRFQNKSKRLQEAGEKLKAERRAWKKEKAEQEAQLNIERQAAREAQAQAQKARAQAKELLKRLRRRWKTKVGAEQERLARFEKHLEERHEALQAKGLCLEQEKASFEKSRLQGNAERELARHQWLKGCKNFQETVSQFELDRKQAEAVIKEKNRQIAEHESRLHWEKRALADQERRWARKLALLHKEAVGLETRIRNRRQALGDLSASLGAPEPASQAEPSPSRECPALVHREVLQFRHQSATALRDLVDQQRWTMAGVVSLIKQLEAACRNIAVSEAEQATFSRDLDQRENMIKSLEQGLEAVRVEMDEREKELRRKEESLEAEWAHFHIRQIEGKELLHLKEANLESLAAALKTREARLEGIRRSWVIRRRQDRRQVQEWIGQCQKVRTFFEEEWVHVHGERFRLERLARRLAERALALEQTRLHLEDHSTNSAATSRRIVNLRRQWANHHHASEKQLIQGHEWLLKATANLREVSRVLEKQWGELAQRQAEVSAVIVHDESADDQQRAATRFQSEQVHLLRMQLCSREKSVEGLRAEVDRLACFMLNREPRAVTRSLRAA